MILVEFVMECDACQYRLKPEIPRRRDRHQEEVMRIAAGAGWGRSRSGDHWFCPDCVPLTKARGIKITTEEPIDLE
jgi:rubredoxin